MRPTSLRTRGTRGRVGGSVAALLALGACLVALTGCGGVSVSDPVAQAATISNATPGFRMTMSMQISVPTASAALTATGGGVFDVKDRAGAFSLDMNMPAGLPGSSGGTIHIAEVIRPNAVYVKLPAQLAGSVAGGRPWVKIDAAKLAAASGMSGLSSLMQNPLSSDPSQFLQYLHAVSGNVAVVGGDWVDGQATTHYRATVDLGKVADALPSSMRDSIKRSLGMLQSYAHVSGLPFDVWVDNHHLVRRIQLSFGASGALAAAGVNMTMQIDFPQYGPQAPPAVPPADQVGELSGLAQ